MCIRDRRQGALGPRGLPGRDRHPGLLRRPSQPRQRGTNENTNGLLRQYFPKGTDLARWSAEEIQAVANALNHRPRKTLSWRTPAEALDEHLRSLHCLLYTSDAADDLTRVDLGGRRILK